MKAFYVRTLLGALLLFCGIAGGFSLWYHYEKKKLDAEDKAFKQRQEAQNVALTSTVPVPPAVPEDARPVEPFSRPGNPTAVFPAVMGSPDEPEGSADSDAAFFSEETGEAATDAVEVAVSPYGFGPYPALPEGWPSDIWPRQSAMHELMMRVEIKLAHQGVDVRGSWMDNGRLYPMIPGTVYVEWEEYLKGTSVIRYIAKMGGDPAACNRIEAIAETKGDDFTEADIPSDIEIVTFEEGGINPYDFLGL